MSESDPHDEAFFQQMRECREPYRRLGEAIHRIVGVQSALDIGCGVGLQTKRLQELGWDIIGAEHAPVAIEMREPGILIEPLDLTEKPGEVKMKNGPRRLAPVASYACVICTETAEHIPEKHADVIVENIVARAMQTIVWSAAAPGQEWHGHINLQPPSYWLERFEKHGWVLDEPRTGALRDLMLATEAQHWMGRQNFCVLVKREAYKPVRFTITSTCYNAEDYIERCVQSVQRQTYKHWQHVVVDAQSTDRTHDRAQQAMFARSRSTVASFGKLIQPAGERLSALENAYNIWMTLPPDEVIVWLDGDDWLATDHALDILARAYAHPDEPWVTYGQFMFATGELGFADRYRPGESARESDHWRATHLKTFRAGLVQQLDREELLNAEGKFCDLAIDRAVMYPLLELAGAHQMFISQILYVYNMKASWWSSQPESERMRELLEVQRMQQLPAKAPLEKRPW